MKLHVRITLAAILLLIAVPGSASPGNFRFGAEWGVLYNFISLEKSTFITADRYLGAGFRKSSQITLLYRAGYGYRIPITGSVAVNVNASALFSLSHPDVYDKYSNQMVSKKNLGMSRAFNSGILLSLAIVF